MALRRSAGTQIVCIMAAFVLTGCASWGGRGPFCARPIAGLEHALELDPDNALLRKNLDILQRQRGGG